ncbi:MAG: hypothetical protein DDG59_10850 [Anaerolineae bacterium]|jgi:hypothetical protein|nr:MAG: hypothetical protein DDG59_10850 [Anaerolineae bacterium]
MSGKLRLILSMMIAMLAMGLLPAASLPTSFREPFQSGAFQALTPCATLLLDAANQAKVPLSSYNVISDSEVGCALVFYDDSYEDSPKRNWLKLWLVDSQCELSAPWGSADTFMTTFHGYDALTYRAQLNYNGEPVAEDTGIMWCMLKGDQTYRLEVETDTHSVPAYGPAANPLPIAEALWALAEERLPLSAEAENDGPPVEPQDSPETQDTTEQDTNFALPPLVIVGSFGIPIAGAILGSVLATLLGLLGNASKITAQPASNAANATPPIGQVNEQGLIWSERPWDEAGPGYVTPEEYERIQSLLKRGYRWDKSHGWVEPGQVEQYTNWQQANREAVALGDKQFLEGLKQNPSAKDPQPDLRTLDMRLGDFQEDLYALRDQLEKKYYVLNPWQGDPTILIHKGNTLKNILYDQTIGRFTGEVGLTCGDYVEKTAVPVNEFLQKHFPGATVESVVFEERSSKPQAEGWKNWFDRLIEDNHNLLKVTLPDGTELAVDFHQNRARKAPLIRKWSEARQEWRDYLGKNEFLERTSFTLGGKK